LIWDYRDSFCLVNKKWFEVDGWHNKFNNEKFFYIYLTLFRFKVGETEEGRPIFNISIRQLYKVYNRGKNINSCTEVSDMLTMLIKKKIVTPINTKGWSNFKEKENYFDLLITLEDTSLSGEDNYTFTQLDVVDYMLKNGMGMKHVTVYMYMKFTINPKNNNDHKCWMSINKLADRLKFGDKTIAKCVSDMNKIGVIASHKLDNMKGGTKFEHYLLKDMGQFEEFNKVHRAAMSKFK
jgi:predicted transcriptional regulator